MSHRWLIAVSMGTHLAVAGGLFASSVWRIERLHAERSHIDISQPLAPPAPQATLAGAKLPEIKQKEQKRVVHERVQPPAVKPDTQVLQGDGNSSPIPSGSSDDPDAPGTCVENCGEPEKAAPVCGDRSIDAGEQCDDGNRVSGDGCSATCQIEAPPKPQTRTVAPSVLQGLRMSGETQVHPSSATQSQMMRDEVRRVTGTAKLCISVEGGVSSAAMLVSTRYPAYDSTLLSAIRAWRYRPYMVGGILVPACSTVTFIYTIE